MNGPDRTFSSHNSDDRRNSTIHSRSSGRSRGQNFRDLRFTTPNQDRCSRVTHNGRQSTSLNAHWKNEFSEYRIDGRQGHDISEDVRSNRIDPEAIASYKEETENSWNDSKKRSYGDYLKQQLSRGYNIEPGYAKRRS